jgi:two-component system sensor histidine kinase PilS (NtrC family)
MLQGELDLKGENRHLMDIVLRETDRLNTIITEFLEYARPKTLHRQKINLASLVNETIALFRNSTQYREGVGVRSNIAPTIAVIGDPQRLRQVFWNLLINAAQAIADRGEITITAAPGSGADEEDAVIGFTDTGAGIAEEHLDNIFDPFFTTKSDGTGLGLAIVYRIIEDHRGTINVRSQPGEGTTFTIKLPFEEIVEPAVRQA